MNFTSSLTSAVMPWLMAVELDGHPHPIGKGSWGDFKFTDRSVGMSPTMYALVFGLLSGLSLPIGSAMGIALSPVSDKVVSMMMAFGAGALLFAVTVELYGHALREMMDGSYGFTKMVCTVLGALAGCAFYLCVNSRLEAYICPEEEDSDEENPVEEKRPDETETVPKTFLDSCPLSQTPAANLKRRPSAVATLQNLQMSNLKRSQTAPRLGRGNTGILQRGASGALIEDSSNRLRAREKLVRVMTTATFEAAATEDEGQLDPEAAKAKTVALALFIGLVIDGVPEGVLMGFLAAEHHLTPVLIVSLFIANFPEAFSSASLLIQAEMPVAKIVGMWSALMVMVAIFAAASCHLLLFSFPEFGTEGFHSHHLPTPVLIGIALTEGVTGGAMLACISGVMLPEAFERCEENGPFYCQSAFHCVSGFLFSVVLKTCFG